ncbi:MAG: hypothetical protein ACRD4S_04280 [Candidatus Acidiferrales bacterium]
MYITFFLSLVFFQLPSAHPPIVSRTPPAISLEAKLHASVEDYTLVADTFLQALARVAAEFQVPMGVEWSGSPATLQRVSLSWDHADVQQVIETIVKNQPGYGLSVDDGTVHVFPKWTASNQRDFTKLRIHKFEVSNMVVEMANHRLRDLVKLTVSPRPPAPRSADRKGEMYSQAANVGDPDVAIKLEDVDVRTVLDNLAQASDRKIWVVTFVGESDVTSTGFWRTLTLWNNKPIPDNEQPVWDMFRWGEAVPSTALFPR